MASRSRSCIQETILDRFLLTLCVQSLDMQRRVRRLASHMFVLCRRQCSAQASGSVPPTSNDLVSIGQTLALLLSSEFMNVQPMLTDCQVMCPFAFKIQKRRTLCLHCLTDACVWVQQVLQCIRWRYKFHCLIAALSKTAIEDSGNDVDTLDTLGHLRWMMQK